jgi:hypothetical protein
MYLSMFLRYSSEVHIFKISNNKLQDYVQKQKIATEWVNDVVYSQNNVFACFENETIVRLYPNDVDEEDYDLEENDFAEETEEDVE